MGPTLTVTNEGLKNHIAELLKIPGAKLMYGGVEIDGVCVGERVALWIWVGVGVGVGGDVCILCDRSCLWT